MARVALHKVVKRFGSVEAVREVDLDISDGCTRWAFGLWQEYHSQNDRWTGTGDVGCDFFQRSSYQ